MPGVRDWRVLVMSLPNNRSLERCMVENSNLELCMDFHFLFSFFSRRKKTLLVFLSIAITSSLTL
eukprot:scaffold3387_cov122-Skeletonema_dohrnii-CCMP3373.AAC.10